MAFHARSNRDYADCRFTGRLTAEPMYDEKHPKKKGLFAPYISISLVSNPDLYSNFEKCFGYFYAWGKKASKIDAMNLIKGDGIEIDCIYHSRTVTEDGVKFNASSFEITKLLRISFAKVKDIAEDNSEDVDDGKEII